MNTQIGDLMKETMGGALYGHLAMRVLAKRLMHVCGRTPYDIEREGDGPDMTLLDETGWEVDRDGNQRKIIHPWTPAMAAAVIELETDERKKIIARKQSGLWGDHAEALCNQATGSPKRLMEMTKRDMYRISIHLCDRIDERADNDAADWYPDGWKAHYDLIRKRKAPEQAKPAPAPRRPDPKAVRLQCLDAVNFVASELGISEREVLELANANRHQLGDNERRAVLGLMAEGVGGSAKR